MVDAKLAAGRLDGYRYADMPDDRETWRLALRGLDETRREHDGRRRFAALRRAEAQERIVGALAAGSLARRGVGRAQRHARLVGVHARDPGGLLLPPVGVERDRLRRTGLPAGIHAARPAIGVLEPHERPGATDEDPVRVAGEGRRRDRLRGSSRGRSDPEPTTRATCSTSTAATCPARTRCAATHDGDEVDLCIVGAGAGGSVLAQRLARRGWRIVILEAGPFWHPDEDWVSDEAGSHELYWTQQRVIGGE